MDWFAIAAVVLLVLFMVAWLLRTKNRNRNLWPTEGIIIEKLKSQNASTDELNKELELVRLARATDQGYTNFIKVSFWIAMILFIVSALF